MNTIKSYRKLARVKATAKGTSHQAELNAIAVEHGHANWGAFQKHLAAQTAGGRASPDAADAETLQDLIDAYQAARSDGGHLVILRPDAAQEERAIRMLEDHHAANADDDGLGAVGFVQRITASAMVDANENGVTLVAGSGTMERTTYHGQFVVHDEEQSLHQINALYSKRDQDVIYATTAVKYVLPKNDGPTISLIQELVGSTTIRRAARSHGRTETIFGSVDDEGMRIEADWNQAVLMRDPKLQDVPFVPAFNILGPKFLPETDDEVDAHLERVAGILIPEGRRGKEDYFRNKGRQALIGFMHVEVGRARRDGRNPTLPGVIDMFADGLRDAYEENERARSDAEKSGGRHEGDALSDWLRVIVEESLNGSYHARAMTEVAPLISMAPNERSGVLGTMDAGLLPFKDRQVRKVNS